MISAKEAKIQSMENKTDNAIKDVEAAIKKSIQKGKTETTFICSYDIIEDLTVELENAGYKVSPVQGGIKIYWG